MVDSPDDTGDDTASRPDPAAAPSTPRWVKVSGGITLVLVLIVVVMLLVGGGSHGPGRHLPSDGSDGGSAPAEGHTPPADGHTP
jgi:hypothetical protein